MENFDEDAPDTPKICESCNGDLGFKCDWCTNGYMSPIELNRWKTFRMKMRSVSGTYAMFQGIVESLIQKLNDLDNPGAPELVSFGLDSLSRWLNSMPDSSERDQASNDIKTFNKKALDMLSSR